MEWIENAICRKYFYLSGLYYKSLIIKGTNQNYSFHRGPAQPYKNFFLYENIVFPDQTEYTYISADFRLKKFLWIILD